MNLNKVIQNKNIPYLLLFLLILSFVLMWCLNYSGLLFDPYLQVDDAETHLIQYYQYEGVDIFEEDPVVKEVSYMMPPFLSYIYKFLVPVFGVLKSAKIVQGVSFFIILVPLFFINRRNKQSSFYIALLAFFVLYTESIIDHTAGGFQRSFLYPCMALWVSGIILKSTTVRFFSFLILAAVYPMGFVVIFGTDIILSIINIFNQQNIVLNEVGNLTKKYLLIGISCFFIILPYVISTHDAGPVHTYEQALDEPALGRDGRVNLTHLSDDHLYLAVHHFIKPVQSLFSFKKIGSSSFTVDFAPRQ